MAYKEPTKRTIRLDDDVWAAVQAMKPLSLNKYLRRELLADETVAIFTGPGNTIARVQKLIKSPLLKPSQEQ